MLSNAAAAFKGFVLFMQQLLLERAILSVAVLLCHWSHKRHMHSR
jgi:hypothetical protein